MRGIILKLLAWSLIAAVLLPVVVAVVLGLGALLAAVGDAPGAVVCRRLGLVAGVLWLVALVATTVASGIAAIESASRGDEPRG